MSDPEKVKKIIVKAIKDQEIHSIVYTNGVLPGKDIDDKTGKVLMEIHYADFFPMIDAHMHIMSLSCAPMTLVWGILFAKDQKKKGDSRKTVYDFAVGGYAGLARTFGFHDFGAIGRLDTELIARMFMGDVHNAEMKETLYWLIWSEEEIRAYQEKKKKADAAKQQKMEAERQSKAGEKAELGSLNKMHAGEYGDFYKNCAYYFSNHKVLHMHIVLPMDLSFAHYWGTWHLPINLPYADGFYFINDFIDLNYREVNSPNTKCYEPYSRHIYYDFPLLPEYDKFTEAFDTLAGLSDGPMHYPEIYFNDKNGYMKETTDNIIDYHFGKKPLETFRLDNFKSTREEYKKHITRKDGKQKYIHILDKIPGENEEKFENYWEQLDYTVLSAVRYPLQLIPFYHYDPRRHYAGNIMDFEPAIRDEHAFFTHKVDCYMGKDMLFLTPYIFPTLYFSDLFRAEMRSNDQVWNFLLPNYFFWGIKMYTELGYAPADFTHFPHLHDFYRTCALKQIPINCHTSPRGMTIADSHNYLRASETGTKRERYTLVDSLDYIDIHYVDPDNARVAANLRQNWKKVLELYGNLKICFAHFGGYDAWKEDKPRLDFRNSISSLVSTHHPNVYTDISCYINDNWKKVADRLADEIGKNGRLKERILMGSDWFMTESSGLQGTGEYYERMFNMLKRMSKKLNWDAWYQFTVINPLRFLGVIDPEADPADTRLDMKNFDALKQMIEKKIADRDWCDSIGLNDTDKKNSRQTLDLMLAALQDLKIRKSDQIKNDQQQLVILSE